MIGMQTADDSADLARGNVGAPPSDHERYRAFGLLATMVPDHTTLVFNPITGRTHLLSAAHNDLLQFCAKPRSLDGHGTAYLRSKIGEEKAQMGLRADVDAVLNQLVSYQLLISDSDLIRHITTDVDRRWHDDNAKSARPREVSTVAVPTLERPSLLRRALASIGEQCRTFGKSPSILVSDDSTSKDVLLQNKQALAHFCESESLRTVHLDRRARMRIARLLSRTTGADLEIVKFGLLGDQNLGPSFGAARNTLLLSSAGTFSLQMDDDTTCRIGRAEMTPQAQRLSLETVHTAVEYHFYSDLAECTRKHTEANVCALDLHAQHLGRKVHEWAAEGSADRLGVGHLSPRLFERLRHTEGRIGITSMGVAGGSGLGRSSQRLFLTGDSHRRLVASEAGFKKDLLTDYVVRTPRTWCISDAFFLTGAGNGFDLRYVLPPFSPTFRSEEAVFAATLHVCSPATLQGLIPYTILHDPPYRRRHERGATWDMQTNDLLGRLILDSHPRPMFVEDRAAYEKVGQHLVELATLRRSVFRDLIHRIIHISVANVLNFLERRLDEEMGQPSYWAEAVREFQSSLVRAALQTDYFGPADVEGDLDERLSSLQQYVGRFGHFLICWPELFEVARDVWPIWLDAAPGYEVFEP